MSRHFLSGPSYGFVSKLEHSLSRQKLPESRNAHRARETIGSARVVWLKVTCASNARSVLAHFQSVLGPSLSEIPFLCQTQNWKELFTQLFTSDRRILLKTVRLSVLRGRIIAHTWLKQANFPYKIHLLLHASLHYILLFFLL